MADRLAGLLRHYSLSARVFHSGAFCGQHHYAAPHGYIHLVRRGPITARSPVHEDLLVTEPSLLFYPRVASHRFVAAPGDTAELLCAEVDLGASTGNPLAMALPSMLLIPLADLPGLGPTLELLFAEAERDQCGRQAAIDRLCELLLIQLLRYLMDGRLGATGLLAGLADPKLARAITAMPAFAASASSDHAVCGAGGHVTRALRRRVQGRGGRHAGRLSGRLADERQLHPAQAGASGGGGGRPRRLRQPERSGARLPRAHGLRPARLAGAAAR